MASFTFALEGVLRQRKHVEQLALRQLGMIQSVMAGLQAQLSAMDESVKTTTDDLRQNRLMGRIDLGFLMAHRRYTLAMQRKALDLATKMAGVQQQMDEAKKACLEAAKRRKAIEKLRERHLERWQADMAHRERAETDEIGMQLSFQADIPEAGAL
jgi:flagellar protein FliJ